MKYYRFWVLAFLLKFAGSAWDASYHFKYLFEKYSIPHLVNFSGLLLGLVLLFREWKQGKYMDAFSRNITTIGYILFLVGIPLDFSYHYAFGIDLTTWSPTHFVYYISTGIMIFGVWRAYYLYTYDITPSWKSLHTWFSMFLLECLLFPNMQQENGAISYDQYIHHHSIASQEILNLISNPSSQIFGGIPAWVYPTYSVAAVTILVLIVNKIFRDQKIALAGATLYILCRFFAKSIFYSVHYPTSYVPITILFIPLAFMFLKESSWITGLIGSSLYFIGIYVIQNLNILITPPLTLFELVPTLILGMTIPAILKIQGALIRKYLHS
ncbi:hypothetical protein [Neobacillus terrae]|uniref:hypothetical protein n=1 Tax=Neobacillus terrae TaxID=3034837 RepID=UPI00140B2653|nr:hypothetical protein [Neobacillus terrae]NHM30723.1 hypothetical protein [Neobacillus terrae]